jgi:hypothetical protein
MIPLRSRNGNQYLHRKSDDYRNRVKRKCAPIIPSSRPALSPRGCSSISLSLLPSWFGHLRLLAANHSSRHPALRIRRGKRAAPDTSRISHGSRKKRFSHEIHR